MRRWRRLAYRIWQVADIAALVAAILLWWFVLRPDDRVVSAVDTVSYLVMVYSVWRTIRAPAVRHASQRWRFVARGEVAERGQQGCVGVGDEIRGESPERVGEDVLTGLEQVSCADRAEIEQPRLVQGRRNQMIRRSFRIVFHRAPR